MGNSIRQRLYIFLAVLIGGLIFLFPTLKVGYKKITNQQITAADTTESKWISKPISLGLDLSGGVHLVYRVVAEEAITSRLQSTLIAIRSELRKEKISVTKASVKDKKIVLSFYREKNLPDAKGIITQNFDGIQFVETSDTDKLTLNFSEIEQENIKKNAVSQAIETLRNRVDQFGVSEPLIQKQGVDRVLLQMPGVQDIEAVKKLIGKVAKLEFRLLPTNGASGVTMKHVDGGEIKVEEMVQMTGDVISNARVGTDMNGQREVSLELTREGARAFARITGENVGRNLAIILDGAVYSAPNINERISGGRCSITGNFDMAESKELATVLRSGALPAPLEVMEEKTVGPSLGAESIRKGITAILIGFGLILFFMIFYYKKAGLIASGVLVLNVFLVISALSAFGATLTLPGLAGLALTVGMAVDANVIIFERIKEEFRRTGKAESSIYSGFDKALSAIIDSNITTLLAGIILYMFGTGPIKGFAVTLSIGILTTIFCATFVARFCFDYFDLKNKKGLSI